VARGKFLIFLEI